ncbi:hypothetical protein DFJ74DRAFT_270942 [Hyaloraphidium curvatum]|nr:hypothetical protein DFJ74DRAFT_270942 [Hyaloraphidium curvatum]
MVDAHHASFVRIAVQGLVPFDLPPARFVVVGRPVAPPLVLGSPFLPRIFILLASAFLAQIPLLGNPLLPPALLAVVPFRVPPSTIFLLSVAAVHVVLRLVGGVNGVDPGVIDVRSVRETWRGPRRHRRAGSPCTTIHRLPMA